MTQPTQPTTEQIVKAINNLQTQITFLYNHLGLTGGTQGAPSSNQRTETGMGAILNPGGSEFV